MKKLFTIITLAITLVAATAYTSPLQEKTITFECFTQMGHDEYLAANQNNEAYFLHFTPTWQTDGTKGKVTQGTKYVAGLLPTDATYDKRYTYFYKTPPGQGDRGAGYFFPEASLQTPMSTFQDYQTKLIAAINTAGKAAGGKTSRTTIFTQDSTDATHIYNDELYFQVVIQF